MAIIGIFLDRRVSVDLARAISVILQVTFIVASAKRNDGSYQDEKGPGLFFEIKHIDQAACFSHRTAICFNDAGGSESR